ncbi:hypothetical protein K466DRAFT_568542 [Polyporus arcularius HHB13444]|uniref:N-acetyltransferase domain-containing protein n=1 Tax=Polyporus arcularius HHB13444 TaxID=1314778 RepID=A0A5C3P0V5_9APHY|nr:hypothetical protein K466DRAFT_568542 [Polyporus arcularius HHB13444]
MAPANVVSERLEHPTEELAEEAVKVFSALMTEDPAAIALTGGDISLIPKLGNAIIRPLVLCRGVGRIFTARDQIGALVGFTLLSLPGQLVPSTPLQQTCLSDFLAKLSPAGQEYYAETMGHEVPKLEDESLGITEAERNTYWCNFAMVRADYQSKGIAKALFALAFQEADKLRATVGLMTTNIRNVAIYEKIGFTVCGQRIMPSPWVDWPVWFFARKPEAALA